jgi:hypothetical protein
LKNIVGQVDEKIDQYRVNLIQLRDTFLACAAVMTEITVIEVGA